jgi:predicted nucleic acid-binding protein
MAAKVVDASALAALLFGEPEGERVAARLSEHHLAAPSLLAFELASVYLKKLRRHPGQRAALTAAFAMLRRFSVETVDVDQAGAIELAEVFGLSSYDAAYLWLARALTAELVTLDKQLQSAYASLSPTLQPP